MATGQRLLVKITRESLPQVKDKYPFIYLERGRLEVDDSSVKWIDADNHVVPLPVATLTREAFPRERLPHARGGVSIRGPFMVQLLSYLQAFGEQGYKANMLPKNRRRLEKGTAKKAGRRYFVSLGRYRDATRHLAPGIWAASGPGGVDVRPVLMFVKTPAYKPRLSMQAVIERSNLQEYLDRRVRYRVRNLAEGKLA